MNDLKAIAAAPIFIIILVVTFNAIKSALNLNGLCCLIVSICVSALAMIGMNQFLTGSIKIILLPYAAMAIAILAVLLFAFIGKYFKSIGSYFLKQNDQEDIPNKDDVAKNDNKQLRKSR